MKATFVVAVLAATGFAAPVTQRQAKRNFDGSRARSLYFELVDANTS